MMTTGSVPGKPGFSSKADAKGPTAGYDPVMGLRTKEKKKREKPKIGKRHRILEFQNLRI